MEKYCTAGQATDRNILRSMRSACWITNATDTHSECVTLIASPRQQWLQKRASILRHTYTARLVLLSKTSRPALGTNWCPIQRILRLLSTEKRPERNVEHSPPSRAEVKNE